MPQNVRNIFDETGEWALSSFDHRHQFIASGVYQLPFFTDAGGVAEAVLGGWRANAIFIAQSGAPFTVNLSVDRANIGAGPAQRPDQLRDPNLPGGERTPERWFDTSAFALQAPFTFGSAPRNSVIGPGYANIDFALAKTWALGALAARVPVGDLQPLQSRQLRSAQPHLRQPQLRPHLQREEPARDAVRASLGVLVRVPPSPEPRAPSPDPRQLRSVLSNSGDSEAARVPNGTARPDVLGSIFGRSSAALFRGPSIFGNFSHRGNRAVRMHLEPESFAGSVVLSWIAR